MLKAASNNHINFYQLKEFHFDTLKQAFQEGRLYIQQTVSEESREEGIQAILQYVARIDDCASAAYRPVIGQLWETVLRSPELGDLFFLNRYSKSRGKPNWYRVNLVVDILLARNIYKEDSYSSLQLHLMMEQSKKRNCHYTGRDKYTLERTQKRILMQYTESLSIHE